jgi:hypothetical protein
MFRYLVTLFVTVAFVATAFFVWTPTTKAGPPLPPQGCIDYCNTQPACFCTSKFLDIPRQVDCEAVASCTDTVCQCTFEFECKKKEERLILQSFPPEAAPQCPS